MTLEAQLTRMPRRYQPERGAEIAALVPGLSDDLRALVEGAAGCSPYLAGLIQKEAKWLPGAFAAPETTAAEEIGGLRAETPLLYQAKRRVAILTALADLGGAWPLEKITRHLTDLADAACDAALRMALAPLLRRGKLPGHDETAIEDMAGLTVLAMGKMGAHELNYSSDIDLICLFDETRFDPAEYGEARSTFVRAVRKMCATLSDITSEGYVFRTDLRLRPDPSVTPVVLSIEAAERYYESVGRTWERAAYIKARPCAGSLAAGQRFLDILRPFVWRRHLDFAAIEDAHNMRLAIREHRGRPGPITLPGHNMKLGRGGIREIEFFAQTRQIIAGGRDPSLRLRGTVESLDQLALRGWVNPELTEQLIEHYRFHRTVEHRLQMVRDAQTHDLPQSEDGFARLAAMMDRDMPDMMTELTERLEAVHAETEGFFAPGKTADAELLDPETIARWRTYPALRSERGAARFNRILPRLAQQLNAAARPDEAMRALDGFLAGLPAGVQLFSLFEANPQIIDLLIDIVGTSPALAHYLSRHAAVLDAVIGGSFFAPWPGQADLTAGLEAQLTAETDYERQLDATRRWVREWHFRVGVHLLRDLITAGEAGRQYADLARASIAALWPLVQAQFAKRHGAPPGGGAIILGMGSLGAGQLTAASDLDIIVIYDPQDEAQSDGPKPLQTRAYYARLTQAMITAMTAQTAEGRLYQVDMRLRPSGNQGPVATSWQAFQTYQRNEAWLWEHMALSRAAVIGGPPDLSGRVTEFVAEVMSLPRDSGSVFADHCAMRERIAAAKSPAGPWDAKIGPGRLQDIELFAQALSCLTGTFSHSTTTALKTGAQAGHITADAAEILCQTHALCRRVQVTARLLDPDGLDPNTLGGRGHALLLRAVDAENMDIAENRLMTAFDAAAAKIDAVLRPYEKERKS
ncbi:MAG: glutamine-synthetase adenylyltransferase [Paracoccaceae bacterium]